jgi:glyoxylase-like metal-dependent hydrolase (beta-lactamase superfamily II)
VGAGAPLSPQPASRAAASASNAIEALTHRSMALYIRHVSELAPGQQLVGRGPTAVTMERAADRVWLMRGGFPHRTMNVYVVEEDGGGVTVFDAGISAMTRHVVEVGRIMGGINRIVLGHAHVDHRGVAAGAGAPVWCHEDEQRYAEADDPHPYSDFSKLPMFGKLGPLRLTYRVMWPLWDGGPVRIERTLREGDSVAGFEVVHFPGHAPGLIGLWRESDRVALVSDTFYTLSPTSGEFGYARVAHEAFNLDTEQARASIRKLAALEPRVAWAGHANPLTGDVRSQLEHAAATT